jgi:ribosomal protein S18 acetylase RimI-like enzyme
MSMTYRAASVDDADAIAAVFAQSFTATFGHLYHPQDLDDFLSAMTADRFRAEVADARFLFRLAEDNGELAGFIKLGPPDLPVETPPGTIQLYQLYLLAPWQGAGIARALMDWALETAAGQGAKHIQLSVYIDNHRARRFYERYGFAAVGRYHFMVGAHADEDIVLRHEIMDRTA